jgi:hypothetical protein
LAAFHAIKRHLCNILSTAFGRAKDLGEEIPSDVHVLMSEHGGGLTSESRIKVTA